MEPPACSSAFYAEAGGLLYCWRGLGPARKKTTIGVFNIQTEQWTLTPTTGPPPPGFCNGGCVIIMNDKMLHFGGWTGSSASNDLHKLNLETFQWSKVHPKNISSEQPTCKAGCGLIALNEKTLVCFGGYGIKPTHVQPGSTFNRDIGSEGWTNEFHLFDIQEGIITNHYYLFSCVCIQVYTPFYN